MEDKEADIGKGATRARSRSIDDTISLTIETASNFSFGSSDIASTVNRSQASNESVVSDVTNNIAQQRTTADSRAVYNNVWFVLVYILLLSILLVGEWIYPIVDQTIQDHNYPRLVWLILVPISFGMMLFPAKLIVINTLCIFGSYKNLDKDSATHRVSKPPVPDRLPRVIVQMPVYKEDFEQTIKPSLVSIQKCVDNYRENGGECHIFINDDGLQLISDQEREKRIDFYERRGIAYVSRPPPSELQRRGLFKKASNMNFCLNFALKVDELVTEYGCDTQDAIAMVKHELPYPVLAGGCVTMDRVKCILLVDSDTRVPSSCLYDTVGEFETCPNLGFAQHAISVLRVEYNYWEDFLAHFTDLVYNVFIPLGTGNGDIPPLVGHNATLNWEAMNAVSWLDEDAGYRCWWSEAHVSEDFDMSLRLQSKDYIGRYIMYTGDGFQEGVSITVFDEIIKLKKYAFGTSEMLFNKVKDWPCKGVFSPLIKQFVFSSVRLDQKLNMLAYLFTYIAMSWAILYIPVAVFILFLSEQERLLQQTSFQILSGAVLTFTVIGNITTILICRLRMRYSSLIGAIIGELKFAPATTIFFSGLPFHIFSGLFRHLLNMKAEWGATMKEMDEVEYTLGRFLLEIWQTLRRYWFMYAVIALLTGCLTALFVVNLDWLEWNSIAMSPFLLSLACHALMPIMLNPNVIKSLVAVLIPFNKPGELFDIIEKRLPSSRSTVSAPSMLTIEKSEASSNFEYDV